MGADQKPIPLMTLMTLISADLNRAFTAEARRRGGAEKSNTISPQMDADEREIKKRFGRESTRMIMNSLQCKPVYLSG